MKIAIVTNFFSNKNTGIPIFIETLSEILEKRSHRVSVISADSFQLKGEDKLEVEVGRYFEKLNKKENYDLVLCNGEMGFSVNHPKAINLFHGNYFGYAMSIKDFVPDQIPQETFNLRIEKSKIQKKSAEGKYVVAVSNFAVQGLNDSGIKVNKVINNTADLKIFHPIEGKTFNYALYTARGNGCYYEKGFDIIEKLANEGMKIKLFSDIRINSENVENNNFIKNKDFSKEYNQACLLVQPTRFEGGSLISLESMACACPIITTSVGYGFDIKDEIPEFVVSDVNNAKEFLEKYTLITRNRKKYSKKALDYFLEYHNPEKFKSEWISLIEGI